MYALSLDAANNRLIAATHGRGVWSSPLPVASRVPHDAAPGAGAPRPPATLRVTTPARNGRVDLAYSLPAAGDAVIDVLAPDGRLVVTFALGWQDAGLHHSAWNPRAAGERMAAGLYVFRLRAGTARATARVVVVY